MKKNLVIIIFAVITYCWWFYQKYSRFPWSPEIIHVTEYIMLTESSPTAPIATVRTWNLSNAQSVEGALMSIQDPHVVIQLIGGGLVEVEISELSESCRSYIDDFLFAARRSGVNINRQIDARFEVISLRNLTSNLYNTRRTGALGIERIERNEPIYIAVLKGTYSGNTYVVNMNAVSFRKLREGHRLFHAEIHQTKDMNFVENPAKTFADSIFGSVLILRADYGVEGSWKSVSALLNQRLIDGKVPITVNPSELGGDPVPGHPKQLRLHYWRDGEEVIRTYNENDPINFLK